MAAGLSVRGWTAGIYALLAHAAFKALLFLAAGSVLYTCGTNLMSEMGGLRRRMPLTFVTMLIGGLSLAGIPPFAGAFGKDGVLDAAKTYGGPLGDAVYAVGLVTAFVTAAYVTRLLLRTFFGDYRGSAVPHEPPAVMTVPLVVLAVAVLGVGAPALPHRFGVGRWLGHPAYAEPLHLTWAGGVLTTVISLAAIATVAGIYRRRPAEDPVAVLRRATGLLGHAFYVDELYDVAVVRPVRRLAGAVVDFDTRGIAATVRGTGRGARLTGGGLRLLQNGNVQLYATGLVLSVAVVVLAVSLAVAR
jgi:NADH-quinone oxidoreductase subunit L